MWTIQGAAEKRLATAEIKYKKIEDTSYLVLVNLNLETKTG